MSRPPVLCIETEEDAQQYIEWVLPFQYDPYAWVLSIYPWGEEGKDLEEYDGPDEWQTDVLCSIRDQKLAGVENIREAVSSGHGVGKTALAAWLIHWHISTHPYPQIVVTANTKTQLTTKTWRELKRWQNRAINGSLFDWSATSYRYKQEPETWFASAIPWSASNSEAFAGTHERHVMMMFDEASGIDDIIWEVAAGAFTSHGGLWVVFGNPTKNTGRFFEATFGRHRKRWNTKVVDARKAKMRNDTLIREWAEDWGEDSDYFRVRVLGLPPKHGPLQFISSAVVFKAMERKIKTNEISERLPRIMGVDVARQGDDSSCCVMRHGRKLVGFHDGDRVKRYRIRDITKLSEHVSDLITMNYPDIVCVDGVGLGAGVIDTLRALGHDNIVEVHGGQEPTDKKVYLNKRCEMWDRMRRWLEGADIPDDALLETDLTTPEFDFESKTHRMKIESKEDMKKRGCDSPDSADAISLTFYHLAPTKNMMASEGSYEPDEV